MVVPTVEAIVVEEKHADHRQDQAECHHPRGVPSPRRCGHNGEVGAGVVLEEAGVEFDSVKSGWSLHISPSSGMNDSTRKLVSHPHMGRGRAQRVEPSAKRDC